MNMNKNLVINVLKNYNNITLLKYSEINSTYKLYLKLDDYEINIITDYLNYCYIDSLENDNEYLKNLIEIFNINIIFSNKYLSNILNLLNKTFNTSNDLIKVNYKDYYNIFRKSNNINKIDIDYDLVNINFNNFNSTISKKVSDNIPKELVLNSHQIKNLLINEIKKINSNLTYDHYIFPDESNPYNLIVRLKFNSTSKVYNLFQKLNKLYQYDYIELKLLFNSSLFPFIPPSIEYVKPKINMNLLLSILNLNILKFENWTSNITIEYIIINLANKLEEIISDYIIYEEENELETELVKLSYISKLSKFENLLNIDIPEKNKFLSLKNNNYLKAGTGYGSDNLVNWDINKYISEQEEYNNKLSNSINKINKILLNENESKKYNQIINNSILCEYLNIQTQGVNILEFQKNINYYLEIFICLKYLIIYNFNQEFTNNISTNLKSIYYEMNIMIDQENPNTNLLFLNDDMKDIYTIIELYISKEKNTINTNLTISHDIKENYINIMKQLQFSCFEIPENHKYIKNINTKPTQKNSIRILSEISGLKTALPIDWSSTIWVRFSKTNFNLLSFMISGPSDTPYENGLFEFHAYFPNNYPETVPQVLFETTGYGTVRFNPNLYNTGTVCLSLLGTWKGQNSESWNPNTSTFLQILISIQSLIFNEQPYFNEPGYEKEFNTAKGTLNSNKYNDKLYKPTIEFGMIDMIKKPPNGFEDIINNHFKLKKEEIINNTLKWQNILINQDQQNFINKRNELIELLNKL